MYNQNAYLTFQGGFCPPANFSVPPPPPRQMTDQEYLKTFEKRPLHKMESKKIQNLHKFGEPYYALVKEMQKLTELTITLEKNSNSMSKNEWNKNLDCIQKIQNHINSKLAEIQQSKETKILKRIQARKGRRKRVRFERKREKEERLKQWEERSRKIDENLQKIKDLDDKAKQDQESKAQADIVLKEVLRKKGDAKKCIAKLEALIKLRRARQNTAKGRGVDVSESDAESFNCNIEKLKSLWTEKLSTYEKEESELRSKLKEESYQSSLAEKAQRKTLENLSEWQKCLFGGGLPQRDFGGDSSEFVRTRCEWDRYISSEKGTALPVGWVLPASKPNSNTTTNSLTCF